MRESKTTARSWARVAEPLKSAGFRRLALGRLVTMAGNAIAPIALSFAVLDATGSVTSLGMVVGARSVANVVFLLFGGVVADRLPRAAVLMSSSALSALSQGAVAAMVLSGHPSIGWLTILSAFNGMTAAFAMPASSALLPQTIASGHLQQANALLRLGQNAALISGTSCAGVLVAAAGPGWGLAVDAVGFAMAGVCFAAIRSTVRHQAAEPDGPTSLLRDLKEGWSEFRSRAWVWAVVVGFMVLNAFFVAGVQVLGPAIADEGIGRRAWGLVMAAETSGMALGALVAMRMRPRRLLLVGVVSGGSEILLLAALALMPCLPVLLSVGLLAGLGVEVFGVAWETSLQQHIPAKKLARVYSYDMIGSFAATPVAEMAIGPVAHQWGTEPTLVTAVVICVGAVAAMVVTPGVRKLPNESALLPDVPHSSRTSLDNTDTGGGSEARIPG